MLYMVFHNLKIFFLVRTLHIIYHDNPIIHDVGASSSLLNVEAPLCRLEVYLKARRLNLHNQT